MFTDQRQALDAFLENRAQLDVTGNALIVCRNGEEIYRRFTGDAHEKTLFRICSMTKVATVTAALRLYEQGYFDMDDPLEMYMPEYADMTVWDEDRGEAVPAKNKIRVRDLFCMSAGLTYGGVNFEPERRLGAITAELEKKHPGSSYTTLEYCRAIAKAPLAFEPGTHWWYSLCHDVLGALIEVLTGLTLGEYMKKAIFDPLGMKDTFFRCPEDRVGDLAPVDVPWWSDDRIKPGARYEAGGAGLLSTADDYMRFACALANNGTSHDGVRILGRKTIELMRMDQLNDTQKGDFNWSYLKGYSYGLGVRTLIDPAAAGVQGSVGEFGWCGLLGTWMMMDPAEGLAAVYMHQRMPNLEHYVQRHLRPMIYAMID